MRFNFTGEISLNSSDSKNPSIKSGKTQNGDDYMTFNPAIVAAKNNRAFCEIFGSKQKEIKTMDKDNNKITINWEDRNDEDVVDNVASYKKNVIVINETRHEFISSYDFVEFLVKNKSDIEGKVFTVTGQTKKDFYKGKVRDKYQIQSIYEVTDERKNALNLTAEMFFTKDSIDGADWKDSKVIRINGYTNEYIDKSTGNKYVPQQFVFDASKIDFENELHVKQLQFRLKQLGLVYKDGKIGVNLKSGKVYSNSVAIKYINGAEEKEFSYDELSDEQKEAVDLGLNKIEDFRPKNSIFGDRKIEYRIVNFPLMGDYSEGLRTEEFKQSEFEDEIYVPATDESADDVLGNAMNPPEDKSKEEEDLSDILFG